MAELDVLVGGVAGDVALVAQIHDALVVGGGVGEPVVALVKGELCLATTVGQHAPDLHQAGADRVEVDVLAVGGIFGAVVEAFGSGEADFVAARDRDRIDVVVAVALGAVDEGFAIGGPAVPIAGDEGGDGGGFAAGDGKGVDGGAAGFARGIGDGELFAVGGNAVVVVDAGGKAGGDRGGFAASGGDAIEKAAGVVDELAAVTSPIGGLDVVGEGGDDFALAAGEVEDFEV